MGCCLSSGKVTAPPISAATTTQIPAPIEEETVKEVVVQSVSVSVPDSIPTVPEPEVSDSEPNLPLPVSLPTPTPDIKSDISSVTPSHSYSTATTATAASILEDDALSKPHRPLPPSTSRRNRPQRISRSQGERYSPQGKPRPRLVRERPSPQPIRRNADLGSRTGSLTAPPRRRSRSPATARRSPMKKREEAPVVKKEETNKVDVEVKKEGLSGTVSDKDPQVSMECFIFL